MSSKYTAEALSAYEDIKAAGGPIMFYHEGAAEIDEATDTQIPGVPEFHSHIALIETASPMGGDTFETGKRVRTNSRKLTVPAYKLPVMPVVGYTVLFAGDAWSVDSVAPLAPDGGDPILYVLLVTR